MKTVTKTSAIQPLRVSESVLTAVEAALMEGETFSGFVLELNYKKVSIIEYIKKRTTKVVVPFLLWSFIYLFINYIFFNILLLLASSLVYKFF